MSDWVSIDRPAAPAPATTAAPPRRRRIWSRLLVYLVALPLLAVASYAGYVRLTRLPDVGDSIAVLLPRDGVLAYIEMAPPPDVIAALRGTRFFTALTGVNAAGAPVLPPRFADDDARSYRKEVERAGKMYANTSMMAHIARDRIAMTLVQWEKGSEPALYLLARSKDNMFGRLMQTFGLMFVGYENQSVTHRDVVFTSLRDLKEEEDSVQIVQFGDVFVANLGSTDPANMTRIIDAWYKADARGSYHRHVHQVRERLDSLAPPPAASREWIFMSVDADRLGSAAIARARDVIADDEEDALEWVGTAEMCEGLDSFAMIGRSGGGRLELAGLGRLPTTIAQCDPASPPAGGGDFVIEARNTDTAGTGLYFLLPLRDEAYDDNREAVERRLAALEARAAASTPPCHPLRMRLDGALDPSTGRLGYGGTIAVCPAGGGASAETIASRIRAIGDQWLLDTSGSLLPAVAPEVFRVVWPSPSSGTHAPRPRPAMGVGDVAGEVVSVLDGVTDPKNIGVAAALAPTAATNLLDGLLSPPARNKSTDPARPTVPTPAAQAATPQRDVIGRFVFAGGMLSDAAWDGFVESATSHIDKPGERRRVMRELLPLRDAARTEFVTRRLDSRESLYLLTLTAP